MQNFAQTSLDSDIVFADGYAGQLATASGSVKDGVRARWLARRGHRGQSKTPA